MRQFTTGGLTAGFTCRRDKQDSTAHQPLNLRKSRPHTHAEGGQVQTVLAAKFRSNFTHPISWFIGKRRSKLAYLAV